MRVCCEPGCPTLTTGRRCTTHTAQAERDRGTRQQRGYGPEHQALRAQWAPEVANGTVRCARCNELIDATEDFDLGHTDDRTGWTGPEHRNRCNRAAGGRARHGK